MLGDLLLKIAIVLAIIAGLFFMPRWVWWLGQRSAYSTHDVLRGEHGLDRLAYVLIFAILFAFLVYLGITLAPLFHEGAALIGSVTLGLLLTFVAVAYWPRKRPPNEWHD